jgi:large subunit ribosomal protein L27
MSHVVAGGAAAQTKNMVGKRLGVKKYAGQEVKNGNILVKQRGSVFHAGKNTKMSRDFCVYAIADGFVSFRHMTGSKRQQYFIDVLPERTAVKGDVKIDAAVIEKVGGVVKEPKTVAKKQVAKAVKAAIVKKAKPGAKKALKNGLK